MESQPQNTEFRNNRKNFHPCMTTIVPVGNVLELYKDAVGDAVLLQKRNFRQSALFWSQSVQLVLTMKMSTRPLCLCP